MECPYCSAANLAGADLCTSCGADLTDPAALEECRSPLERDLLSTPLSRLSRADYVELPADLPIREAVRRMTDKRCHCAVIVDRDAIVGIFTERDVLTKLAHNFPSTGDRPVREFMTASPETLRHSDPIVFGLNRMMVGGYRHIPLERDGKLSGLVSVRDVLRFMAAKLDEPLPSEATA